MSLQTFALRDFVGRPEKRRNFGMHSFKVNSPQEHFWVTGAVWAGATSCIVTFCLTLKTSEKARASDTLRSKAIAACMCSTSVASICVRQTKANAGMRSLVSAAFAFISGTSHCQASLQGSLSKGISVLRLDKKSLARPTTHCVHRSPAQSPSHPAF